MSSAISLSFWFCLEILLYLTKKRECIFFFLTNFYLLHTHELCAESTWAVYNSFPYSKTISPKKYPILKNIYFITRIWFAPLLSASLHPDIVTLLFLFSLVSVSFSSLLVASNIMPCHYNLKSHYLFLRKSV